MMNSPFLLSFRLALICAPLTVALALPLAWFLAYRRFRGRVLIDAAVFLPLVLPPTVLGFYLLMAFQRLGGGMNFRFSGLVTAGVLVVFPLVLQNLKSGMELVPRGMIEASLMLGKSRGETFLRILLPQIRGHLATALALSFAKLIGEFGVMMMVGGNIPGRTRLASLALFERVEALDYRGAHLYALVLVGVNVLILSLVMRLRSRDASRNEVAIRW